MKTHRIGMNGLFAAVLTSLLTACGGGSGFEGEYIGVEGDSMIESITLDSDGVASVVYPLGFGNSGPGSYTIDGNTVHITLPGGDRTSLEIDANGCLTHFFVGTYCRNGGGKSTGGNATMAAVNNGGAERYEATTDEGRIQLEFMAGGTARLTMMPFGSDRDMPQRASFDLRYTVRGDNIMIEMPGEGPTELRRSGRDLLMTVDGEMARFVRQ